MKIGLGDGGSIGVRDGKVRVTLGPEDSRLVLMMTPEQARGFAHKLVEYAAQADEKGVSTR